MAQTISSTQFKTHTLIHRYRFIYSFTCIRYSLQNKKQVKKFDNEIYSTICDSLQKLSVCPFLYVNIYMELL